MQTKQDEKLNYATLNRRVISSTIDIVALTFVLYPMSRFLDWLFFGHKSMAMLMSEFFKEHENQVDSEQLWIFVTENHILIKYLVIQLLLFTVMALFFIMFWVRTNQTIGKMVTKCVILDADTGKSPTRKQYIIRFFSYILSTITLCIGFFMVSFTKRAQGLHDLIAKTVVVVKK